MQIHSNAVRPFQPHSYRVGPQSGGVPHSSPYSRMSNDLAVQLFSAFQLLSTGWGDFLGGSTPAPQTRPFFENFLEDQNQVHGGRKEIAGAATQAYPSDSDHDLGPTRPDIGVTRAYPSDSDHDHGPSKPPISFTQAYPSDSDQDGGGPITFEPGPKQPPISFTMAYPSDSDQDGGTPITFEPGPKQPPISFTMAYPSDSDQDL